MMTPDEAMSPDIYVETDDMFETAEHARLALIKEVRRLRETAARVEALIEAGEAGLRVVEFSTLRAALRGEP